MNNDFKDIIVKDIDDTNNSLIDIKQIKLEYFYSDKEDATFGSPISTSVEYIFNNGIFNKIILHKYHSLTNINEISVNEYIDEIKNFNKIKKQILLLNLNELKNNYFTDIRPINSSRWEITYNYYFKIVGTNDNKIPEYNTLCELFDFNNILKNESSKVLPSAKGIGDE